MITKRLPIEELIDREARKLALEDLMCKKKLSRNKPLPDDIVSQVEILLSTTAVYRDMAKQNILAQKAAHEEVLKSIGLNPIETDAITDLDL